MCGFLGVCDFKGRLAADLGESLLPEIRHRGRDEEDVFSSPFFVVAVARMAITGDTRQPVVDGAGNVLAWNGALYREPRHGGIIGPEDSDTTALADWLSTDDCDLSCLIGMFSFVRWSHQRHTLLLARDHLGQKPLYWSRDRTGRVWFASELQVLLRVLPEKAENDEKLVPLNSVLGFLPAPHTLWRGVWKLRPATQVSFNSGSVREHTFWSPCTQKPREPSAGRVYNAILKSVREQVTQRRVVVFQSGGVDSSTLLALTSGMSKSTQSMTCGVVDAGKEIGDNTEDQSDTAMDLREAARVAAHLGVPHCPLELEKSALAALQREAKEYLDEEYHSISYPLTWALFQKATASNFRVALMGEGADELFAGYFYLNWSDEGKLNETELLDRYTRARAKFTGNESLLEAREVRAGVRALLSEILRRVPQGRLTSRLKLIELAGSLPEALLARVDRLSSRAQLEIRLPFLTPNLVKMAMSIPLTSSSYGNKTAVRSLALRLGLDSSTALAAKRRFGLVGTSFPSGLTADMVRASP